MMTSRETLSRGMGLGHGSGTAGDARLASSYFGASRDTGDRPPAAGRSDARLAKGPVAHPPKKNGT